MSYRAFFGTETEYAFTAFDAGGAVAPPRDVARHILKRAAMRPHLRGAEPGIFLTNGGRLYIDVGNHPEFASPETVDPFDGVRYSVAGDRLLAELVREVAETEPGIARTVLRKGNVDYASAGVTWASHENYLCRNDPVVLRPQLVPHLVSRIVFTGSGGFDPFASGHPRFVLSPRSLFMRRAVSLATIEEGRALVDERNQPHCHGFHRQHLMCGDALRSHLASFLRLGTTALVLALVETGLNGEEAVHLADPLAALDTVTRDVSLTRLLQLANGHSATALDIQRHYLCRARASLDVLPTWAAHVCDVWEDTLDRLSRGAAAVADRLDWAIKLAVYEDRAARHGLRGRTDEGWHRPSWLTGPHGDEVARWRTELFEIETRFGQIHPPGLFDALEDAGVLRHRIAGIADIDRALVSPPATGRAAVRGVMVARLAGHIEDEWRCGWDRIEDGLSKMSLDLSDPFVEEERWCDRIGDPDSAVGLAAQVFRLSKGGSVPPMGPSIRELVERICLPDAKALRRQLAGRAIDFNARAIVLRKAGRLEDAEWVIRLALAIDIEARSATHPKIAHRRNNLSTVLILLGRLDEMEDELGRAWQIVGTRYDLTSARILLMRLSLACVRREPADMFIGQLKTHLRVQPLPDYADVVRRSEAAHVFDDLGPRLGEEDRVLLRAILEVLNGDRAAETLDDLPRWHEVGAQPLDGTWPKAEHLAGG